MKLDVGCGAYKREGYIGVDPYLGGDVIAPMWDLPFGDSSVAEIFSDHALEHISKAQVVPTLTEFRRVLIPLGLIVIQVPDLIWCCQKWIAHQSTDWYMDIIFGGQGHEGEYHKTGYTFKIMEGYMKEAGLTLMKQETVESHGQPTLRFEATK